LAVFFSNMTLARLFWTKCPNPIGSALVASKMYKSWAKKSNSAATQALTKELDDHAQLVDYSLVDWAYLFDTIDSERQLATRSSLSLVTILNGSEKERKCSTQCSAYASDVHGCPPKPVGIPCG